MFGCTPSVRRIKSVCRSPRKVVIKTITEMPAAAPEMTALTLVGVLRFISIKI
jgi:hypothetical protein